MTGYQTRIKLWQEAVDRHPYRVIETAAGPMCSNCQKGIQCWLAADDSPCSCKGSIKKEETR